MDHRPDDFRQRRVRGPLMPTDADIIAKRLIEVVSTGDTDGFLDLFTDHGFVDDWGRTFTGHGQIRAWSDEEFIGAHGHLSRIRIESTATTATIVAQWSSERHTGPSRFVLHIAGGGLRSMTITEA